MSRPRVLPGPLLRAMAGRRTNLALLWLLVGATLTGALNFALGTGWVAWPTVLHGVTGFAIVLLSGWKWAIARRGLDRRGPGSTWPSVLLGVLVVVAIVSGVLHSTGLVLEYGPVDDMQVHVGAGLAALPLSVWHLLARGGGAGRPEPARRELLRAALLLGSAGTLWVALEGVVAAAGLRGARRRATGSFEVASGAPERMPAIIWLFDPSPVLDPADWRAEIIVPGGPSRRVGVSEVDAAGDHLRAVIDCTSGWWSAQQWRGAALPRLVGGVPDDVRSVLVRSVTGYERWFPIADLPHLLLATRYAGRPLAARHGAPARLVAPGRRGFWWVKWVDRIELSTRPWWQQPPYPLQ